MKTDPISDSLSFLIGNTPDHEAIGPLRYVFVAAYAALLIASLAIANAAWRRDPAQQTLGNLWTLLFRILMGTMWFQGSIWKLPLPVSGGLQYWTGQMAENAAYPFYADIVKNFILPNMALFDPLILATELGLAASFMLGLFTRPVAALGCLYALGLWLGLYRNGAEWPWEYIFIVIVQGQFAVDNAGRRLGLDALRAPYFRT